MRRRFAGSGCMSTITAIESFDEFADVLSPPAEVTPIPSS
jgi:hypothetical protein